MEEKSERGEEEVEEIGTQIIWKEDVHIRCFEISKLPNQRSYNILLIG
jgi:hypothetical protein